MAGHMENEVKDKTTEQRAHCFKHLSKSASELDSRDSYTNVPQPSPSPQRSGRTVAGVLQRTHGFLSTLKHRWSRGRSKERGYHAHSHHHQHNIDGELQDSEGTDYAADNSSDHSSSATHSPRHKPIAYGDSPLARTHLAKLDKQDSLSSQHDPTNVDAVRSSISAAQAEELQRKREATLRQHVFFQLRIHLISGHNLKPMDKNGTSDPYVKFKLNGRLLHKSKTVHKDLNPVWDETFIVPIEDPFQSIQIKVFDYDWGLQDDFIGSALLDLTTLELSRVTELMIPLEDSTQPSGTNATSKMLIKLNATLWPRTQEDKEQYFQRNPRLAETSKRMKSQIWSSVVTIVLIEARNLPSDTENNVCEPYVRFRLGNEKYKSKTSWQARWLEQFDLHLFDEEQSLEITLWNRSTQYGKCVVDLRNFPREETQSLWQQLEDSSTEVYFMLTISGTTSSETITDLTNFKPDEREHLVIEKRYRWLKTFQNLRDVGHLTVKVFGATGLAAADLGGKSDPFCVLELINSRLQTQTEYKTLSPNWNKIFTFNVKDVTAVLDVTVFDEDRDHKVEFLGRVCIPLLRIHNNEKRWYALKDKKMFSRAKGNSPQILLELNVVWNPLRAAVRALEPQEEKLVQQETKFKRQIFLRNVNRLKSVVLYFLEWGRFIQSCFEWESPIRSTIAFILWVCGCIWMDISTIPAILMIIMLKNWFVRWITGTSAQSADNEFDYGSDDEDEEDKDREEKKTIKERLQTIQEVSQTVQNSIGRLASLGESVKNTFNFSVSELSWLAVILLVLACLVLHYIPIRILLLVWGCVKFSRRLLRPHTVPNNEVLDLLSRVPDDDQLIMYREIAPHIAPEIPRRDLRKKYKAL
ncbi:multiple C2 and transmembrane domain-containing protein isoform X2 [Sitodiplosis mosellana]|uniref:multiple C2 and transmembrane domain-containing protein isoform X2 n=1 Tax=Sitodiplosis mosellana TaxID=263140 RepID=UPI002444A238|nr:multiple C2 and transmembrane domain-containing protein isoform X2 [Sitodiplosis mosellana]XP_055315203.1 multiple C2 and transmembrane domain-containing protein isoform X2 [Sitodiplosis mosellana]XP_055315204.1 multiple C2 and transmembrane domain-containing protein isoform X2 [Sitodiplosis mosellana]